MDFSDTPEQTAFRAEVRAWLAKTVAALPPEPDEPFEQLTWWQAWQRQLQEAGYAGISWPREYGGRGADVIEQAIFAEEYDLAGAPQRLNALGEGLAGPTIIEFGTDEHKRRFLPRILDGSEIWCQLFSEPNAGSDLASLATRARRDGDGWRITGSKVWTSGAHFASFAILLARTGEPASRHRGITYFLLPMRQPEVEVRPLVHMLGGHHFNEVILDDVFVSDDARISEVDGGWAVAMATLGYERGMIASAGRVNTRNLVDDLVKRVRASKDSQGNPLGADPVVRQTIADLYSRTALQRLTGQRILSTMAVGEPFGPEASTAKLFTTRLVEDLADFGVALGGLAGQEEPAGAGAEEARWLRLAYESRGTSIAGGTTFIQRNIVSERALGLPRS